jgi:hypothetical protein
LVDEEIVEFQVRHGTGEPEHEHRGRHARHQPGPAYHSQCKKSGEPDERLDFYSRMPAQHAQLLPGNCADGTT